MLHLFRNRYHLPSVPQANLSGKIVLVTGANVGLGLEAAAHFVRLNVSTLILASRNIDKGETAKADIEARSGRRDVVRVWKLDMDTFEGVKKFSERIDKEVPGLDIAVLNAGVHVAKYCASPDGWEKTLQVNTLSTALLALLLLPKLEKSRSPTFLPCLHIVGSIRHTWVRPNDVSHTSNLLLKFNDPKHFDPFKSYNISKLLILCFVRELAARRVREGKDPTVVINCSCPGAVWTELGRDFDSLLARTLKFAVYSAFARTPEEGSRTYVNATLLGAKSHGAFIEDDDIQRPFEMITSTKGKELQKQIWVDLMQTLQSVAPKVVSLTQTSISTIQNL